MNAPPTGNNFLSEILSQLHESSANVPAWSVLHDISGPAFQNIEIQYTPEDEVFLTLVESLFKTEQLLAQIKGSGQIPGYNEVGTWKKSTKYIVRIAKQLQILKTCFSAGQSQCYEGTSETSRSIKDLVAHLEYELSVEATESLVYVDDSDAIVEGAASYQSGNRASGPPGFRAMYTNCRKAHFIGSSTNSSMIFSNNVSMQVTRTVTSEELDMSPVFRAKDLGDPTAIMDAAADLLDRVHPEVGEILRNAFRRVNMDSSPS